MYDTIIVGARVAGSPLAMLLARRGARVLLVDRTTFPSDTLNGHFMSAAAVKRLERWGLVDRVQDPGLQPISKHAYHFGPLAITGNLMWPNGEQAFDLAPRRKRADALFVDAAAEAGAEVRQGFWMDDLVRDGERVVGIRGRDATGRPVEERARVVVGADGFRSRVAASVDAPAYEAIPSRTCIYFSHWADWPGAADAITVYVGGGTYMLTFPTDDNLMCLAVGWPNTAFARVRADIEAEFMGAVDRVPLLAEMVRAARRVEPFRGTGDLPFFLRKPYGPGWALVGDAGCRVDPITGQGITDAFRDVDLLADAICSGDFAGYQRARDEAVMPIYRYTSERAKLEPPTPEAQRLFSAIAADQDLADQFAGVTGGTTNAAEFFAPQNIARIIGGRAVAAAA